MSHADLSRRRLLGLLGATLVAGGCDRGATPQPNQDVTGPARQPAGAERGKWREMSFAPAADYPEQQHATVLEHTAGPLLVALHGAGEVAKGPVRGSHGWRDDYDLGRAHERLLDPPLSAADLLGFVREDRLQALNRSLQEHPYKGLCVACPFTPRLADRRLEGSRGFADFVIRQLLPRVRRELGLPAGSRAQTGIDGVSMGGRLALLLGLANPDQFGAVGALQPAIGENEAGWFSTLAARAQQQHEQHLRLVTSDEDYFRPAVESLSRRLTADGVRHELLITPGPHDYVYNRGPGSFEMLLWHERVLRGLRGP